MSTTGNDSRQQSPSPSDNVQGRELALAMDQRVDSSRSSQHHSPYAQTQPQRPQHWEDPMSPWSAQTWLGCRRLEAAAIKGGGGFLSEANQFQRNLASGFISRRPKEKVKITAGETAHKSQAGFERRRQAGNSHSYQRWLSWAPTASWAAGTLLHIRRYAPTGGRTPSPSKRGRGPPHPGHRGGFLALTAGREESQAERGRVATSRKPTAESLVGRAACSQGVNLHRHSPHEEAASTPSPSCKLPAGPAEPRSH